MNTFDWLTQMDITDVDSFDIIEVSFKNGARKSFYMLPAQLHLSTGDLVVVEAKGGYDIGRISLSGELVRLQMKKRKVREDNVMESVIRLANERDLERLQEARMIERDTLVKARAIANSLDLDLKMGDIEYRGDKRKATFFYTANGRVDFRELIRHYARDFRVKIEMRQIGARQESARIGGIGSCGRELCCSTWLTDFKSVSTAAARYQNLAINQAKLSGQCGRLKCCLNYELDAYMEAVQTFPTKADKIHTVAGTAFLVKTDIFKQLMFYAYNEGRNRGKLYALGVAQVEEILALNRKGEKPMELGIIAVAAALEEEKTPDYEDVTGVIELPMEQRKKKRRNKRRKKPAAGGQGKAKSAHPTNKTAQDKPKKEEGSTQSKRRPKRKPRPNAKDKSRPNLKENTGQAKQGEKLQQPKPKNPSKKSPAQQSNKVNQPKSSSEEGTGAKKSSNRNRRWKNKRRKGGNNKPPEGGGGSPAKDNG